MHGIIQSGDRPPSFALPNQNGKEINSAELLASGPVVITVFRQYLLLYRRVEL
jgi:peroxiredoxin